MGEVEDMMCVVCVTEGYSSDGCHLASDLCRYYLFVLTCAQVRRVRRGSISLEQQMCDGSVHSILSYCGYMPRDNRCVYMAHVCFYVWCSNAIYILIAVNVFQNGRRLVG